MITVSQATLKTILLSVFAILFAWVVSLDGFAASNKPYDVSFTDTELAWLADHPVIRLGVASEWPPLSFENARGSLSGTNIDYIRLLNKRLKGAIQIESARLDVLKRRVWNGELDALMGVQSSGEINQGLILTEPYMSMPDVIIAKKSEPFLFGEESLKGKVIAIEEGFALNAYFKQFYPDIILKTYPNTQLALDAVARGEVTAYAGNRTVALYIIGQELIGNLDVHGRLKKQNTDLSIGLKPSEKTLHSILNKVLLDLNRSEIRDIQSRWVGKENTTQYVAMSKDEMTWLRTHPRIRIAFDSHYPPYSFLNEQGEFVGIAVDIANTLASRIGIALEVYPHGQWQQLYSAAQHGEVDVIATLVKRAGRENWFEFTRPYLSLSQYIIAKKKNVSSIKHKHHLRNRTVALIRGYSTSDLILSEIENITPYYVGSLQEALEAVSTGKAYATVGDIGMANHTISRTGLTNLGFSTLYTRVASKQRFGVRKDWPQLANILDKALESLSYQELIGIYAKWNMPDVVKPEAGFLSVIDELTESEKAWLDAHPVIRLASDYAWPPFESISESGAYNGIAADYMNIIEQRLGVEFKISPRKPWDQVLSSFKDKDLDILTCAMETDSRKAFARFTTPYISHPMVIVTRNDVGFIDGLNGLENKTIAIERGYASFDLLSKDHPELNLVPFPDSKSAMVAVSSGEVFSYIGNVATLSHIVREQGITNIKVSGQVPYNFSLSIGVREDWPELMSILQKTLDSISVEKKNEILQKWIAVNVEEPIDYFFVFQVSILVIIVIVVILYWNLSLNLKVSERTAQLEHQAHYDTLTKLPNRVFALDRLEQLIEESKRSGDKVAVLFLDLDDFKKINDTLGHETGDNLLVEVSKRITPQIRSIDTFSRLGGDEFILLISHVKHEQDIIPITQNILGCFQDPFYIQERELLLTISIGISVFPHNGKTSSELLRSADTAMYSAKKEGRNTYSFFTESMSKAVVRQLALEEQMYNAIDANEFEAYFQPKVHLVTRKIIGFEALLRWKNNKLGNISPIEFIPVAENNGLILSLGRFVLKEALKACKVWCSEFDERFTIAVNLSPRQFRDKDLVKEIGKLLDEYQLKHENLELEITEGVLMSGQSHIKKSLNEIKALGSLLAMDDFGTGYSSLSYLRNYPFDTLKIDREFINDITTNDSDRALAVAAISMAHGLGLSVVAEGVETKEQLELLQTLRCDVAQGYYISRPLPFSEMTDFIKNGSWT